LYVPDVETVTAWRPDVPGVREVFHARFTHHAYPVHTHDCWTLLIVDDGAVRYGLDRREHGAVPDRVTLLPPHVPHDGRPAVPGGFAKRVVYLEAGVVGAGHAGSGTGLDEALAALAVRGPTLADPLLRHRVAQLHRALAGPEPLEAASRLALIGERLAADLRARGSAPDRPAEVRDPGVAHRLRDLLDATLPQGTPLDGAAAELGVSASHLVRAFRREYGVPPHRYLTGRRIDLARRLLLDGEPPSRAAAAAGFYDQAHLTRHFRRMLGTTPGRYVRPAGGSVVEVVLQPDGEARSRAHGPHTE
jgi:AraC-like DNA-binding protein